MGDGEGSVLGVDDEWLAIDFFGSGAGGVSCVADSEASF